MLDAANEQMVTVKANVRKSETFYVKCCYLIGRSVCCYSLRHQVTSTDLDFGSCILNEKAAVQHRIHLTNTSKSTRVYEMVAENGDVGVSGDACERWVGGISVMYVRVAWYGDRLLTRDGVHSGVYYGS